MSIVDEYNRRKIEILSQDSIDASDYNSLWNICINFNDGDIDSFGESDLTTIIKALDKLEAKRSSLLFANSFATSLLLHEDFIPFIKKFEEKILFPASDLTGEIKRNEHITLIFSAAANIRTTIMWHALQKAKDKDFHDEYYTDEDVYQSLQFSVVEFLQGINKGTPEQKFQCLLSIDKLIDEYPETRIALSKLVGFENPTSFMDILVKALRDLPSNYTNHIQDALKVVHTYEISKELEIELADKEKINNKKLKL